MDVRKLNRSLIEIAVSQGIREIRQDTKRGLRRLSDLGQYFAGKRFSQNIFIQIHEALKQEDSRYYQLIQNCLDHIEEEALKTFGINIGYNSWTYGVGRIRQSIQEGKKPVPWFCEISYNGQKEEPSESLKKVSEIIKKKRQQGVYTYFLYPKQSFAECPELIFLLDRYPDCAFVWFFQETDLTDAQLKVLKRHKNCLYLFPAVKKDGTPDLEITSRMKKMKILYSYYYIYKEIEGGLEEQLKKLEPILQDEPAALIMKADLSVDEAYRLHYAEEIWRNRLLPEYPIFLVELTEDCRKVNEMIARESE